MPLPIPGACAHKPDITSDHPVVAVTRHAGSASDLTRRELLRHVRTTLDLARHNLGIDLRRDAADIHRDAQEALTRHATTVTTSSTGHEFALTSAELDLRPSGVPLVLMMAMGPAGNVDPVMPSNLWGQYLTVRLVDLEPAVILTPRLHMLARAASQASQLDQTMARLVASSGGARPWLMTKDRGLLPPGIQRW